jgi:hypothetical protein
VAEGFRQEVINVALARLLQDRGLVTAPKYIFDATLERGRKMVDVIVYFNGLRTAIEGEVDDQPDAKDRALESARRRVQEGVAHIGVAVVYPAALREVPFDTLQAELSRSLLQIAVVTEAEETGFSAGDVNYLQSALQAAFERLVKEDTVAKAVSVLRGGVERFATACVDRPGILGRAIGVLGIKSLSPAAGSEEERVQRASKAAQERAAARIAALVLSNALIFQEVLSNQDPRVTSLAHMPQGLGYRENYIEQWYMILAKINYYPIFHVATDLLRTTTADKEVVDSFRDLARRAAEIVEMRAPMRHDLMGRVYHRLLVEAKYLGTYYTSIPAATLLLELALRLDRWNVQWHNLEELSRFRVVDLACGTGTLLTAAAQAVTENYIEACQGKGPGLDLAGLHRALAEDVLYGYDVLPSAVHLTASTIALRSPTVAFKRMNLFSLPLGGEAKRLGSIEFLQSKQVNMMVDLFGQQSGAQKLDFRETPAPAPAPLPDMDLCVMNPPFTRSVGGNLLFGSSPPAERKEMQKKLSAMLRDPKVLASSTAGLGSVFLAVAHSHVKPGGRLAVVLPKAVLSGIAWGATREMLRNYYRLEYIIASHDPERWNFSENTSLSEVLLVAVKRDGKAGADRSEDRVTAVNLWRNPSTPFEALAIARTLRHNDPPDVESGQGALELSLGEAKLGEAISMPWEHLKAQESWLLPCAFAQADLVRVAYYLLKGHMWLPGYGVGRNVALAPLADFAEIGPDRRDIHDGFRLSQAVTAHPALWGHDADAQTTLRQEPNAHLSPLGAAKSGRPLRKVEDLWPLAGRVLVAERLWLNTQRLAATRLTERCLANVWWPLQVKRGPRMAAGEKALALWFNSTLGLISLLCHRLETRGAWVCFKKPVLRSVPVIDLEDLSDAGLRGLGDAYDRLADKALAPFPQMHQDPVRAAIDGAVCKALRLPDLSILRTLLAQEPVVCLKGL